MSASSLGQMIMIGVSGHSLTADEKKFIVENDIGGVTLFGRNVKDPQQVHALCSEIQSLRKLTVSQTPLYIAIDMEGGRVARLRAPWTVWPPLRKLGDINSPTLAFDFAFAMGRELASMGINVDWAPSVDVFTNPENKVIGDRSLSSDPEVVGRLGSAIMRGYIKAGINPCVKHFPGHGNTLVDSHEELPVESLDLERLKRVELIPFKKCFSEQAEMLMTSHILFKNIDPQWPVTLSEKFLQELLRRQLGYRGLIISDDLGMKAMSTPYGAREIPVRAVNAGVNVLLYCNEFETPPMALEALRKSFTDGSLKKTNVEDSLQKIAAHKALRLVNNEPMSFADAQKVFGSAEHQRLSTQISEGRA